MNPWTSLNLTELPYRWPVFIVMSFCIRTWWMFLFTFNQIQNFTQNQNEIRDWDFNKMFATPRISAEERRCTEFTSITASHQGIIKRSSHSRPNRRWKIFNGKSILVRHNSIPIARSILLCDNRDPGVFHLFGFNIPNGESIVWVPEGYCIVFRYWFRWHNFPHHQKSEWSLQIYGCWRSERQPVDFYSNRTKNYFGRSVYGLGGFASAGYIPYFVRWWYECRQFEQENN